MDAALSPTIHAAVVHARAEGVAIRKIRIVVALLRRGPIIILPQTTAINRGKQIPLLIYLPHLADGRKEPAAAARGSRAIVFIRHNCIISGRITGFLGGIQFILASDVVDGGLGIVVTTPVNVGLFLLPSI